MKLVAVIILTTCLLPACHAQRDLVRTNNPTENFLYIHGTIDAFIKYEVRVEYVAMAEMPQCKKHNWVAGTSISKSTNLSYKPTIMDGRHSLKIPLKAYSAKTYCNWEPRTVYLCIGPRDGDEAGLCTSLFFIGLEQHDNNSTITVLCRDTWICFREPSKLHTERVEKLNQTYTVNIQVVRQDDV